VIPVVYVSKPAAALLALTLALAVPATASASPTTSPSPTASGNSDLRPEQGSAKVASKAAPFISKIDDPHYSSSHAGSVNVHGWWLDTYNNFSGMKARVTVYLWAKKGSQWVQVNKIPTKKNPVTVYAGGGGGKRASGSVSCRSHKPTWYHGQVDVDIIDAIDTSNRPNSQDRKLNCQPW